MKNNNWIDDLGIRTVYNSIIYNNCKTLSDLHPFEFFAKTYFIKLDSEFLWFP